MAKKTATFAQRLREGLDLRGMKQIELATRSGISKYSISHYLKGDWEGKQDAVYELARVLNVSEAWLMGYDVPAERSAPKVSVQLDKKPIKTRLLTDEDVDRWERFKELNSVN